MTEAIKSLIRHGLTLTVPFMTAVGIGDAAIPEVMDALVILTSGVITWTAVKILPGVVKK